MSRVIVFQRQHLWLPKVLSDGAGLRLEFAGGADALHNPRTFSIPITDEQVAVVRDDLARHLILSSALLPLCAAAGVRDSLDEAAAVALLVPILLASAAEVDAFLQHTTWEHRMLVAHGGDIELLRGGRVVEALSAATEHPDWRRAQEDEANHRRSLQGVTLTPLDAAVLKFTGQYLHGSTKPHRDARAVEPGLLPEVLRVVATAEGACAGLSIDRDPRRGKTGTDKQGWRRMEEAVETAVRGTHPELAADAVRTVTFLMCSEAATRARTLPFDVDAPETPARLPERVLTFTDDTEFSTTWHPGDDRPAVEAFWVFVAERVNSRNEVFTLEDETRGDGIQLHLYSDSVARVRAVPGRTRGAEPEHRVEHGLLDDLAQYRAMVRGYVAGGFDALDGLARWMSDPAEFERARRRRTP